MTETLDVGIDHAAEDAVIGSILTSPTALIEAADHLVPADFYQPRNELIFAAAMALTAQGQAVDPLTVGDLLTEQGSMARVGMPYLLDKANGIATATNVAYHAAIVRDAATARRARSVLGQAIHDVDQGRDVLDVLNGVRVHLDALATDQDADVPNEKAVYAAIDALDDPPGDPTPWPSLTEALAGWKPGVLYICGARPAVGKSIIGANATLDMARRHKASVLFSLEMSRHELYHRMLSSTGRVQMDRMQHRRLDRKDRESLARAAEHIAGLQLVVDDRSSLSVAQMRAKVKATQRKQPVGLVVVDYLQLVRPADSRADRRVQVDQVSRDLKVLAKDLQVPVLALTQLNRGPEQRMDKTPHMSDLRESGGQEQDADVVMLLHRDWATPESASDLHVIVGKNRHGPQARFTLAFQGHYSTATENESTF